MTNLLTILTYGFGAFFLVIPSLLMYVGTYILWRRTKNNNASMIFFGLTFSFVPYLMAIPAATLKLNLLGFTKFYPLLASVGYLIAAIGLIRYALSLPKNNS